MSTTTMSFFVIWYGNSFSGVSFCRAFVDCRDGFLWREDTHALFKRAPFSLPIFGRLGWLVLPSRLSFPFHAICPHPLFCFGAKRFKVGSQEHQEGSSCAGKSKNKVHVRKVHGCHPLTSFWENGSCRGLLWNMSCGFVGALMYLSRTCENIHS